MLIYSSNEQSKMSNLQQTNIDCTKYNVTLDV